MITEDVLEFGWLGAVHNLNNSVITQRSPISVFSNFYRCSSEDLVKGEHCAPNTQEASQLAFCRKKLRKIGRCSICDRSVGDSEGETGRAACMSECLTCITETCHEAVCKIKRRSGSLECKSKDYFEMGEDKFYSRIRRTLKHMCPME